MLARPYARRTAGIPTAMHFDLVSKEFMFSFRDDLAHAVADPSEIFIPVDRHYPHGFSVEVTQGDRWEFDASHQRLLFYRGGAPTHSIRIAPQA